MSDQRLRLVQPTSADPDARPRKPIGRYLVEAGILTELQLVRALEAQRRQRALLGEVLLAEGLVSRRDVQLALAQQHNLQPIQLSPILSDPKLLAQFPARFWLRNRLVPWMRLGNIVLIATARPDLFDDMRNRLAEVFPDVLPVVATEDNILAFLSAYYRTELATAASERVDARFSCRDHAGAMHRGKLLAALLSFLAVTLVLPLYVLLALITAAVATLFLFAGLRLCGFCVHLRSRLSAKLQPDDPGPAIAPFRLPRISMLVPLYKEQEIASALLKRLERLDYPRSLLEVLLVLEEKDEVTRAALAQTPLPPWMRVIEVPAHGQLTTKPRAMNYALDFCGGDIIGVWDAEDAPSPDQLHQVALRFADAPEDLVCLQGVLDYYNPRTNWMSRCFTIEYASWFRIVLPGIAQMGLVVPLGGTTLFFKRDKLEELGGWDAHNVTEDADLGVRLCRAGYRTELIPTVTYEEANCRPWRWVKQRSRWLKGFMVTYAVHMRHPADLLRELGPLRFISVQAFFLGTLGQFLLAPVLWSFWLILLGFDHPAAHIVPEPILYGGALFLPLFEGLALLIGIAAVIEARRRYLIWCIPTMMFYYPLGVLAAYKALFELLRCPHFWDKTQHGHAPAECEAA
jgi:cellulose synthase/poly-beta-1,6-N-acetylglucosamine synthase-like glycosyltransferase